MGIVLIHDELGDAEYVAVDEDQAAVLALSGWKRKPEPKTEKKEKTP